jgi:TRAP-type C4-dicarboxylate transport system substrate-binding protein
MLLISQNAIAAESPKPKKFSFKLATTMPMGQPMTQRGDMMKKLVEERSNGRITVQHYPAGQLFATDALTEAVPTGAVQLAFCQSAISKIVPDHDLFNLMFLMRSEKETYAARDAAMPELRKAFNKKFNAELLGWVNYECEQAILFTKPVSKLSDFKGRKVRNAGGGHALVVQAIGCATVEITSSDVYLAMQRGTIDGVSSGTVSHLSRKWYEVAKYLSGFYGGSYLYSATANLDWWKTLSAEDQKLIRDALLDVQAASDAAAAVATREQIATLQKYGVKLFTLPEEDLLKAQNAASKAIKAYYVDILGKDQTERYTTLIEKAIGRTLFPS